MSPQIITRLLIAISTVPTSSAFLFSIPSTKESNQFHRPAAFLSSDENRLLPFKNNIRQPSVVFIAAKQPSDDRSQYDEEKRTDRLEEGIRLNKVFKATHSRRAADTLIGSGRVSVNGKQVLEKGGFRVIPYQDVVKLDDVEVTGWEEMNSVAALLDGNNNQRAILSSKRINGEYESTASPRDNISHFQYIKYWKPLGVTCTTDPTITDNIIDSIRQSGYRPKHRVYPVGRLDKETTGLILLTSDGRLPNAVLRGEQKQPKVYQVLLDRYISDEDIKKLRHGIIITTVAQRDNKRSEPLTRRTKRCEVRRLGPRNFEIILTEGRNRQIRKMVGALNYTVVTLRRIKFMGVTLQCKNTPSSSDLKGPGDWAHLDDIELSLVRQALTMNGMK